MNIKWLPIALILCLPLVLTSCTKTLQEKASASDSPAKSTKSSPLFARFVPEREDDFAWENDLVAFRAYGPALRNQVDAGTDCWLKRVKYPILNKWYRLFTEKNIS